MLSPLERGPGLAGGASWAGNPAANLRRPSARSAEGDPGPLAGNQRRPSSARFGAEEGPDPSLLAGARCGATALRLDAGLERALTQGHEVRLAKTLLGDKTS